MQMRKINLFFSLIGIRFGTCKVRRLKRALETENRLEKQSYINIVFIFRRTWKKKKNYKAIFMTFPRSKRVKKCLTLISVYKQTELLRGVCFSPVMHEEFKKAGDLKSPVKVRKFKLDKQSENTVLMYSNIALDCVDDNDFPTKEIPTTNNIGTISAISTNQMIAIKAKLLQKGGKKKTNDGEKFLVNAFLGDPHGTIKVTLWEPFSDLEEGKIYQFDNLVVRTEYNTKDIIFAKPKTGCKAVETASFKENVIQPFELLKSLTTTTTPAEILGVQSFTAYHSYMLPMQKEDHSGKIHRYYL